MIDSEIVRWVEDALIATLDDVLPPHPWPLSRFSITARHDHIVDSTQFRESDDGLFRYLVPESDKPALRAALREWRVTLAMQQLRGGAK